MAISLFVHIAQWYLIVNVHHLVYVKQFIYSVFVYIAQQTSKTVHFRAKNRKSTVHRTQKSLYSFKQEKRKKMPQLKKSIVAKGQLILLCVKNGDFICFPRLMRKGGI